MAVSGVMLVLLIVIFGWLVFGRYVLNDTPTWVEQLSLLLVVWITFLGAAVGVQRDTHLSVDFIRESMPSAVRGVMRVGADLMVLAFGILMAWQGWVLAERGLARAVPMLGVSEVWRGVPVVVCGVLIVLFVGARLGRRIRALTMSRTA